MRSASAAVSDTTSAGDLRQTVRPSGCSGDLVHLDYTQYDKTRRHNTSVAFASLAKQSVFASLSVVSRAGLHSVHEVSQGAFYLFLLKLLFLF